MFELDNGEILDAGRDEYDWTEDGVVGRAPVNGVVGRPDEVVEDGVVGRPLDEGGPRLDRKGEMLDRVERVDISPPLFTRAGIAAGVPRVFCVFRLFEFSFFYRPSRVLIGEERWGERQRENLINGELRSHDLCGCGLFVPNIVSL